MNGQGDGDRTKKGMEIRTEKGQNGAELLEIYQWSKCPTGGQSCWLILCLRCGDQVVSCCCFWGHAVRSLRQCTVAFNSVYYIMLNQLVLIDPLYRYNMGATKQLLNLIFNVILHYKTSKYHILVEFSCPGDNASVCLSKHLQILFRRVI